MPHDPSSLPRKRRLPMLAALLRTLRGRRYRGTRPALTTEHLPALGGRTEIVRDDRGVPHIYAARERDAMAVLGYLQAADRFLLLDAIRHVGSGRLSEWLGDFRAPTGEELFSGRSVADVDGFVRPLGFQAASDRDWQRMQGPARDNVAAFSEGVNAALRAMQGVYPVEYLGLGPVRLWTPADCLLLARTSGFIVALIPLENELTFDAVRGHAGDDLARQLYPEAPWENVPKIERHGEGSLPEAPVHLPAAGSNNWAVSGARSASGAPVLANDPHVPLLPLPTYWYHVHIECPEYRVQGGCFPGYPAFGYGHNGDFAWGCTTVMRDAWDLYRVHRLPGEPQRYRTADGTGTITAREEPHRTRLRRRGTIRWEECEHGILYPGWKHDDGADLAVRFAPSDAGRYLAGYRDLAASSTVAEHRAALSEMNTGPFDFNHAYAHREGHIGWEVFGQVPRRSRDGLFVRDAHDPEAQWQETLDFEAMPKRLNPECGFVASANSMTDPSQSGRVATATHYEPRFRQDRIEANLAASDRHSIESFQALQSDVGSDYAPPVRDALVALLPRFDEASSREGRALARLRAWDGSFDTGSAAAAIFFFTLKELGVRSYAALLGPNLGRRFADGRRSRPRLQALLLDPDDPLRAGIERAAGRSLSALAADALGSALERVTRVCGPAEGDWAWGRVQRAQLGTALALVPRFGKRLLALDAPFPGDDYTVNPSRSLDDGRKLRAFVGATSRFVCDLAHPEEAWFAHSSGPSADPASEHHDNLCEPWSRFEYFRSALWPADAVPDPAERVVLNDTPDA